MFLTLVCKETSRLYFINKKIILETKPLRFKDFISKYSTQLTKESQFVHIEGIPFQNNKRALKKDVNNDLTYHDTASRALFFKNWQGSWSVSQWDHTQKELIIARDKFGTKSIYYYDCPHCFVYTDTLDKLLNLPFIPKELNSSKLIQLGTNGKEDGQTFFSKINQLPKAHYIKLVKGKVSLNNYWLPSYKATLHYNNHSDYVDSFNEIYSQVIYENLEGFKHPSIALSSGLDSGSMYAIAAPYLKNKNQPLSVLTWHTNVVDERFNSPNRIKDETYLVKELIHLHSNTRFYPTASQFGNILSSYRKIISSNHQPIVNLQPHIMEVFDKGHEIGVDVMLNGFEGNFTVSHTGHPTICRSNALDSVRALKSRLRKMARFFLAQSGNSAFKNTSRDYIRKEAVADNVSQYQALTEHLEGIRKKEDTRFSHIINALQSNFIQDLSSYTQTQGFESRTPVLDDRIIDFCFSIPNDVFYKNGESKRLLKAAMTDKIPNSILYNKHRGLQGTNYVSKFRHESTEINYLLDEFSRSNLVSYWLDVGLIKQHFNTFIAENVKATLSSRSANLNVINRGIQVGLFLQGFENGRY